MNDARHAYPIEHERAGYFDGIRLFNQGDYFEAHDAWEEVWSRVLDRRREKFYRALIQSAVTLELLRRGRAVGVRQVFASCLDLFAGLPPVFMGLRIEAHLARLRGAIRPALDDLACVHVQIEPQRLFEIALEYDPFVDSRNGEGLT